MKSIFVSAIMLNVAGILLSFMLNVYVGSVCFVAAVVLLIYAMLLHKDESEMIEKLFALSNYLKEGDFDKRVIYIKSKSKKLAQIADNLNNMIDGLEAYLREINTSITCSQNNEFYRKALPEGLKGIFAHNKEFINKALSNIEVTAKSAFKNALSKTLMDLSLGSQNKDMSRITTSLNADINAMNNIYDVVYSITKVATENGSQVISLQESDEYLNGSC